MFVVQIMLQGVNNVIWILKNNILKDSVIIREDGS